MRNRWRSPSAIDAEKRKLRPCHEVTVPVELVWGAADKLLTVAYAERMVDGLPRARLHPIKGCGHVPQRECPIKFLEALTNALAQPPPEATVVEAVEPEVEP